MTWVLVIFFYVGIWGDTDSVATTTVEGFKTEQMCEAAARKVAPAAAGTKKEVRTVCVRTE